MTKHSKFKLGAAACVLAALGLMQSAPAQASDAGYFLGGMLTSRVLNNMKRRTQAEEVQAYNSRQQHAAVQTVPVATPAAAAPAPQLTPEQQLQQLDKLAAGGYITPEQYKARRQAILNSM
jgi:hypothetical protein